MEFIERRVADARVVRLIKKWLHAGVLEDGQITRRELGTVQGGSISPLLADVYLHYAFDLRVEQWRRHQAKGAVVIVRYADGWMAGFEHRADAERFRREVDARLKTFGLALHENKTRLIEFGRFARENRRRRGQSKPETFDFLGFAHCCGKTRTGRFMVLRITSAKRRRAKLHAVKYELRRRMHRPIAGQGPYLRSVVAGHTRYFGVPNNGARIGMFRLQVSRLWHRTLCRRSQSKHLSWQRMHKIVAHWLPSPGIRHPYPNQRLIVTTQGKSRVRNVALAHMWCPATPPLEGRPRNATYISSVVFVGSASRCSRIADESPVRLGSGKNLWRIERLRRCIRREIYVAFVRPPRPCSGSGRHIWPKTTFRTKCGRPHFVR